MTIPRIKEIAEQIFVIIVIINWVIVELFSENHLINTKWPIRISISMKSNTVLVVIKKTIYTYSYLSVIF